VPAHPRKRGKERDSSNAVALLHSSRSDGYDAQAPAAMQEHRAVAKSRGWARFNVPRGNCTASDTMHYFRQLRRSPLRAGRSGRS
jgi:hypothetical protein